MYFFVLEKVQMQGTAVGRAVDLTLLRSYDELIRELEKMFEIEGELRTKDKWAIVFTDDEGDMMLVGDDPWEYVTLLSLSLSKVFMIVS